MKLNLNKCELLSDNPDDKIYDKITGYLLKPQETAKNLDKQSILEEKHVK